MTRLKLLGLNSLFSLMIYITLILVTLFYLYPPPFFSTDGGLQGVRLIIAIDLVLGPVLFFLVYKKDKQKLKNDFLILSTIRLLALVVGVWVVFHERPVAVVFTENRFSTLTAYQLNSAITPEKLRSFDNMSPAWIFSNLPEDIDEMQDLRAEALQSAKPIAHFHEYYQRIGQPEIEKIANATIKMDSWLTDKQLASNLYQEFLGMHPDHAKNFIYYPWNARHSRHIIVLNRHDLSYVAMLEIISPSAKDEKLVTEQIDK